MNPKGKFENSMGLLGETPKAQKTGAETAVENEKRLNWIRKETGSKTKSKAYVKLTLKVKWKMFELNRKTRMN